MPQQEPPLSLPPATISASFPRWAEAGGVLLLAAALMLGRLWEGGLDDDPVLYAAVAKSILHTGDWITMHVGDAAYFNKPPLVFWIVAMLYQLAGVSVWAARLPSALAGVGCAWLLFRTVRAFRLPREAVLAGVAFCLSNDVIRFAANGRLDMPQAFFFALALYGYVRGVWENRPCALAWIGLACGLGLLTKGPLVFFALPVILTHAAACGRLGDLRRHPLWIGLAAGALLAVPWHAAVMLYNPGFWDHYVGHEMLDRMQGDGWETSSRLEFAGKFVTHFLPWTPFALWGAWVAIRTTRRGQGRYPLLLLLWSLAAGFIAFGTSKLYPRYQIPLYLPLCALAAMGIGDILAVRWQNAVVRRLPLAAALLGTALLIVPAPRHSARYGRALREMAPVVRQLIPEGAPLPAAGIRTETRGRALEQPEAAVFFYCDRMLVHHNTLDFWTAEIQPAAGLCTDKIFETYLAPAGYRALVRCDGLVLASPAACETDCASPSMD